MCPSYPWLWPGCPELSANLDSRTAWEKLCNRCHWALSAFPCCTLIFPAWIWPIQTRASHPLPGIHPCLPYQPGSLAPLPLTRNAGLHSQHPRASRTLVPSRAAPAHSCRRWAVFVHKPQHLVPQASIPSRRIPHCPSQPTGLPEGQIFPSITSIFNSACIINYKMNYQFSQLN